MAQSHAQERSSKMNRRTLMQGLLGLTALAALPHQALAQAADAFPNRTVTLVVPWAPGGSQDTLARVLAEPLSAELGQTVVVDNRPGASGTVGSGMVARAKPDGYTLLMGSSSTYAMAPHLYQLGYDNERAFSPAGLVASMPILMLVPGKSAANSVQDFVAMARKPNSGLSYASSGVGSSTHLATEMFLQMAGVEVQEVTYKGGGPAVQGLLTGETQMTFQTAATVLGFMRTGDLKALAVASPARIGFMPDIPTFAESGLTDFEVVENIAMLAPAGTPDAVLQRINTALAKVMVLPRVQAKLTELAINPTIRPPAEFPAFAAEENAKWRDLIKARNIRVQ
jgi:tripartite-type tricarboxylate transporter receptor subunit TctC